jgi:hypothetical protein
VNDPVDGPAVFLISNFFFIFFSFKFKKLDFLFTGIKNNFFKKYYFNILKKNIYHTPKTSPKPLITLYEKIFNNIYLYIDH